MKQVNDFFSTNNNLYSYFRTSHIQRSAAVVPQMCRSSAAVVPHYNAAAYLWGIPVATSGKTGIPYSVGFENQ